MKNIVPVLLCLFMCNILFSQVTVSPELGISYLPFELRGANTENESKRVDALLGVSAQLPIHINWYMNTRISYSNRENIKWSDLCTCPGYLYNEFRHYDLNFDLTVMTIVKPNIYIGVGPIYIKKFIELQNVNDQFEDQDITNFYSDDIIGVNFKISIHATEKINFNLSYNRIISNMANSFYPNGRNRVDITISYKLLARK